MATNIDPEELERRRQAHSSTPDEERTRCEECGSPDLRPKSDRTTARREYDEPYICGRCGEHVEGTGGKA